MALWPQQRHTAKSSLLTTQTPRSLKERVDISHPAW